MKIIAGIIIVPIALGFLAGLTGGDPRWSCWSPLPQIYGEGCTNAATLVTKVKCHCVDCKK